MEHMTCTSGSQHQTVQTVWNKYWVSTV